MMQRTLDLISAYLFKAGLSANVMSFVGLLLSALTCGLIIRGFNLAAVVVILLSGFSDLLDGAIARASNTKSKFGALLDSSLDRYSDGLIFFAVALNYVRSGDLSYFIWTMSAMIGAFEISYVRARAGGVAVDCRVGFWERPERMALISLGLMVNNLKFAVIVLGFFTHVTALTRILKVRQTTKGSTSPSLEQRKKTSPSYLIYLLITLLGVLFVHI